MFGFLKPKPNEPEAVKVAEKVANTAVIEAVLEHGHYSAFLIHADQSGGSLAPYLAHAPARSIFVEIIESRIQDGEFDPPPMNRAALGLPPVEDDGRSGVARMVFGINNTPLFNWKR